MIKVKESWRNHKKKEDQKGAITVMLLLIFVGIFALTALLVEGARYRSANAILNRATDTSIRSTLAGFNIELKETYGIFTYDAEHAQEVAEGYVVSNLDYTYEGSWDPYEFTVESVGVTPKHSIHDIRILERQILEYMKYRGVVSITTEVYEKFSAYFAIGKTVPLLNREKKIDKKMGDIESLIKGLDSAVKDHNGFNKTKLPDIKKKIEEALVIKKQIEEKKEDKKALEKRNNRLRENLGPEARDTQEYKNNSKEIGDLGTAIESLDDQLDDLNVKSKISELETEIKDLKAIKKASQKLASKAKEVSAEINTADKKMNEAENVLSGFRDSTKDKHAVYKGIIDANELGQLEANAGDNLEALESLKSLFNNPPNGLSESNAHNKIEDCFDNYDEELTYELKKPQVVKNDKNSGDTEVFVDEDTEVKESDKSKLKDLKGTYDDIKSIIETLKVNEMIYTKTSSLPSNIAAEVYEEKTPQNNDGGFSGFLAGFKVTDVTGSAPNFDDADQKTEGAIEKIASDFDDEKADPHRDKIMDAVFNRSNIYELRDTLLINEYIMLMFNNRITEHNSSAFYDQCEVEYIIYGSPNQKNNATFAYLEISGHRLVTNVLSLYSCAPKAMGIVREMAAAIAAWQGGLTYFAWELVVAGVYSGIEASIDTYELIDGRMVPMIKQDKDFLLGGPSKFTKLITDTTKKINNVNTKKTNAKDETKIKVKGLIDKDTKSSIDLSKPIPDDGPLIEGKGTSTRKIPEILVDYEDYMRFFIMGREIVGQRDDMLMRIQNLYHMNMEKNYGSFDITKLYTYLYLDVDASIKSMFFSGKFFNPDKFDGSDEHFKERRVIESNMMYGY